MSKQNSNYLVSYLTENLLIQASNSNEVIRVMEKRAELNKPVQRAKIAESAVKIAAMTVVTIVAVKAIRKIYKKSEEKEEEDRK